MEESPEVFDGFYGQILGKIVECLKKEVNFDIVGYNIKIILSITQCLNEKEDIAKYKGVTEIILEKCKYLLDNSEEDKVTNIMFNLFDSIDPNFTCNTVSLYKKNELNLLLQFGEYLAGKED